MTSLAELRRRFPQYDDMDDVALASALHRKYYTDVEPSKFMQMLGVATEKQRRTQMTHDISGHGMPAGPIVDRAGVLPIGRDEYGDARFALPGALHEVYQSAKNIGQMKPPNVADAFNVAGGVTLGSGVIPAAAGEARMGIKAYHGSPHDFDKFSMDKIGTGEGAQAYGHGLYFAENEGVARSYRDALTDRVGDTQTSRGAADRAMGANNNDVQKAIETLRANMQAFEKSGHPRAREYADAIYLLENGYTPGGKMYEVDINADPEDFLDWDAFPDTQTARAKSFIEREVGFVPDNSGGMVVTRLSQDDPKGFSAKMREAGIPGIKYLDQGSREKYKVNTYYKGKPYREPVEVMTRQQADDLVKEYKAMGFDADITEGTRNYVLFRDDIIDIVKKYGWAALTPFGYGLFAPDDPNASN